MINSVLLEKEPKLSEHHNLNVACISFQPDPETV